MVQSSENKDLNSSAAAFIFRDIPVGAKIQLVKEDPWNGGVAEVPGNPRDGAWLLIKFLEHPDSSKVGTEDMVFFQYVVGLI